MAIFRYCEGTGSVIQSEGTVDNFTKAYRDFVDKEDVECLKPLKLRYFTPREISRLLGFPSSLSFPNNVTVKQQYKVLGNSLNVTVVSLLIYSLIKENT